MSIDYSIAAIPTNYRGVQYRSRLEAKWAAFFDIVGWRYDYEPFDLGSWSPDFILHGHRIPILCEVKPISKFDEAVASKMAHAANAAKFRGELMLLGLTPKVVGEDTFSWLGWLDDTFDPWFLDEGEENQNSFGSWEPAGCVLAPEGLDFCHSSNSYRGRMTGAYDGTHFLAPDHLMWIPSSKWDRACNIVQWAGPRK